MANQSLTGPTTYTVESGDTLYGIAVRMYGNGEAYPLIQQANQLTNPNLIQVGQVLIIPAFADSTISPDVAETPDTNTGQSVEPVADSDAGAPIPNERYGKLSIVGAPTDRPAAMHGDLNLKLRGYALTQSTLGLVDINGPHDAHAPQLAGLFADRRPANISTVYAVYKWDWENSVPGALITDYPVTLIGLRAQPSETVHVPPAGYDLGEGYQALVLFASSERLTLKYTREDNVIKGYTIHLENVHAEPSLLALYEQLNTRGRSELPALRAGQALGRARGNEIRVAIRDTGDFMDPRVRKDWWQG